MNQEYSKAVSFINNYCALADGFVFGLENCLATNVVLDWFGKTITGRNNVATFLNIHKVTSRHIFNDIIPTENIGYNYRFNLSSTEELERNFLTKSDVECELFNDEYSNIFKLKNIKVTNMEEIIQKINQISLQEKHNINSRKLIDYQNFYKLKHFKYLNSSLKYVKAQGEILFSKKSHKRSGFNDRKLISSNSTHTWRKPCKLQMAYSSQQICTEHVLSLNNISIKFNSSNYTELQKKLSKYKKITELDSYSFSNAHNLTDCFNNSFIKNENDKNLLTEYGEDQSVFQKIIHNDQDFPNAFVYNNLIHVIIYEGKSHCKINLSHKFK